MMVVKIKDRDKSFKKLTLTCKSLAKKPFVKIGIQGVEATEAKDGRNADGTITPSGITVVEIGNFHEFGLGEEFGVPERSFLRATIDINQNKYFNIGKAFLKQITDNEMTDLKALAIMGEKIKSDCQQRITAGIPPSLSDATLDKKTVNGRVGDTPLIDTGQLYQSITYVVVEKQQ